MKSTSNIELIGKRRANEQTLLKSLPSGYRYTQKEILNQGLLIQLEIEKGIVTCKYLDPNIRKIYIDISMDKNYPLVQPKVKARSSFSKPSLADGRDLLLNVIDKPWAFNITIFELILMIPKFVAKFLLVLNEIPNDTSFFNYGQFYLGEKYDINDWMTLPNCGVFHGRDLNENSLTKHGRNLFVVVTETVILMLEPEEKRKNQCTLIALATLPSLAQIERYLDSPNDILFKWRSEHNNKEFWEQKFELEHGNECVNLIGRYLKYLRVSVEKSVKNRHKLGENEVTTKAIKRIDIGEICNNILIYENMLEESITLSTVQRLMSLYQTGIEYYSALNDANFDDLLHKMQKMLRMEGIEEILASLEERDKRINEETKGLDEEIKEVEEFPLPKEHTTGDVISVIPNAGYEESSSVEVVKVDSMREEVRVADNVNNVDNVENGENVDNIVNVDNVDNVEKVENVDNVENVENVENDPQTKINQSEEIEEINVVNVVHQIEEEPKEILPDSQEEDKLLSHPPNEQS